MPQPSTTVVANGAASSNDVCRSNAAGTYDRRRKKCRNGQRSGHRRAAEFSPQRIRKRASTVVASALALKSESVYCSNMSSVHEIETAVSKLSRQELLAFRDWFSGFDAAAWDKQFEEDVAAGHLDALAEEAVRDLREGRCRDL
jgi:hypothetical protein